MVGDLNEVLPGGDPLRVLHTGLPEVDRVPRRLLTLILLVNECEVVNPRIPLHPECLPLDNQRTLHLIEL